MEEANVQAMPGAPFLDLLTGALGAIWGLGICHYSKQHRTVVTLGV